MKTGYFIRPNKTHTKIHVTDNKDNPICGYKPPKVNSFFCCMNNIVVHWIECKNCLRILKKNKTRIFKEII